MPESPWQALGRRYALVLIGLGVVSHGIGPVLLGSADASGPLLSFWRMWFGVAFLAPTALLLRGMGGRLPGWRGWRWGFVAGIAFGLQQLFFITAITLVGVTDVVLMGVLAPILVAVAAVPLFGERTSIAFRLWSLLAIVGAAVVVTGGVSGPSGSAFGMLLAIGSVFCYAVYFLLSKMAREHIDVVPFLLGSHLVAAFTVTAWCLAFGVPVTEVTRWDLWVAALVAVGPGGVGNFLLAWPLRWVPANVPPVMRLAQPVLAGLFAWMFLAEQITPAHLGGGGLTLLGVLGAMRSRPPSVAPAAAPHSGEGP